MVSDQDLFNYSLLSLFLSAPPTNISLQFLTAPYGKHLCSGWGPAMSPPLAWFFMEIPTLWLSFLIFPFGQNHSNPKAQILILPFLILLCILHAGGSLTTLITRAIGGLAVCIGGMTVNVRSDMALVRLKSEGVGYKIPREDGLSGSAAQIILEKLWSGWVGLL